MRITGGSRRGRALKTLSGREIRPTSDKVREALFDILGPRVTGAAVLDLFAGSGSLGLEALSRGAERVTFVEKSPRAIAVIRDNVEELGFEDLAAVNRLDLLARPGGLARLDGPFDIVFVDPPYRLTRTVDPASKPGNILEALWTNKVVESPRGLVLLEHDRRS
ncbi:MAG: hypothetical protein AMS16_04425, partial [Planctomycetes bacterium DG_58]